MPQVTDMFLQLVIVSSYQQLLPGRKLMLQHAACCRLYLGICVVMLDYIQAVCFSNIAMSNGGPSKGYVPLSDASQSAV
jgi:hypothetical protein